MTRLPKILVESVRELQIISDPEFQAGLAWGEPRPGHPEGAVAYHINEVLANLDGMFLGDEPCTRERLRLIALVHDTFKYQVNQTHDHRGENHHAWLARHFAEQYHLDVGVLEVIELHDEAFSAWRKAQRQPNAGRERAERLIDRLKETKSLALYLRFFRADNATGDKQRDSLDWFRNVVICYSRGHDPKPRSTTSPSA